ncbi:MAG: hypothetical protein HPY69_03395 [Armatimonadetes bacterium]|nr:hypothetical protein [Armatimonadota bacterium]
MLQSAEIGAMPRGATGTCPVARPRFLRATLLGCVLLVALLALTPYNDYFIRGSYMANHHVPVAASFVLLMICLVVNPWLRRLRPGRELARSELALTWGMMAVSSGLASAGLMRFLVPTLPALRYFASPENDWEEVLHPLIPAWLVPTSPRAIAWFYDGSPPGYGVPWGDWLLPILAWSVVAILLWIVMLCLAAIFRAQWVENERMTFIHVQLPMALIESPPAGHAVNRFLSNRLMWLGFLVPVVLYGLQGLSTHLPAVPRLSIVYPDFYNRPLVFRGHPWDAAGSVLFAFLPSSVGFGFLLTTEVSLSAWFCFVLSKLEAITLSAFGLQLKTVASGYGSKQFAAYQDMGAYLALIAVSVYVARGHLRSFWSWALTGARDGGEALPPRVAVCGGLAAFGLLLALAGLAGLSLPAAGAFLLAYFVVCTAVSWLTSNTGVLQLPVAFRPEDYLYSMVGTRALRPRDLAMLAIPSRAFTFYYNELQMPHYLNNYKLAGETGVPLRTMTRSMALAVSLGLVVAWVAQLGLVYAKGANSLQNMSYIAWPRTPFEVAAASIRQPSGPDPASYLFMTVGAAKFLGFMALRSRYSWWMLHPAGLVMGSTMQEMWFSLFLAWLCKTLVLRYGGARGYQAARNLFLGLAAGEATIACVWIAVGFVTGTGVRMLP